MQSLPHDGNGWSRRRFLLVTLSVPAVLPVMPARGATSSLANPAPAATPAPAPTVRPLEIVSSSRLGEISRSRGQLVLHGDPLLRLRRIRQRLAARPGQVTLRLDATDQVMWDLAMAGLGITACPCDGGHLQLDYHRAGVCLPAQEARA